MWQFYVYIHYKVSDGAPFYVGKGKLHKHEPHRRAFEPHSSRLWKSAVAEHGVRVELHASCSTDQEAQTLERHLIASIGRRDLGLGPLVNLTDGGDGHAGLIVSAETRAKRSLNARGKRSPVWVASIRASRKNGGNGGVVKQGDKLPDSWRANIAKGVSGSKNPMYGKITAAARRVQDADAGIIFPSVGTAAIEHKLNMKTLYNMLSGHRPNKTSLRFCDGL